MKTQTQTKRVAGIIATLLISLLWQNTYAQEECEYKHKIAAYLQDNPQIGYIIYPKNSGAAIYILRKPKPRFKKLYVVYYDPAFSKRTFIGRYTYCTIPEEKFNYYELNK